VGVERVKKSAEQFFDKKASDSYDERNARLAPISSNLHLLIRLVLKDLPADARILCVGAGTVAEILYLAEAFPDWRFIGVDPSASMLEVCEEKLKHEGINDRCTLITGYADDVPDNETFDAVLCLLVTHFIKDDQERQKTFDAMAVRLKPKGYLINADISYDTTSPLYDDIFEKWLNLQQERGEKGADAADLKKMMAEHLSVLPASAMEQFLKNAGLPQPVKFFQSLLISAWYSQKL